jgi:hypothetical protein
LSGPALKRYGRDACELTGDLSSCWPENFDRDARRRAARLTSKPTGRRTRTAMIARKILLDHCLANGRYSPSRSQALHGRFVPVVSIEF